MSRGPPWSCRARPRGTLCRGGRVSVRRPEEHALSRAPPLGRQGAARREPLRPGGYAQGDAGLAGGPGGLRGAPAGPPPKSSERSERLRAGCATRGFAQRRCGGAGGTAPREVENESSGDAVKEAPLEGAVGGPPQEGTRQKDTAGTLARVPAVLFPLQLRLCVQDSPPSGCSPVHPRPAGGNSPELLTAPSAKGLACGRPTPGGWFPPGAYLST